jgi:hypothetical protein
MKNRYEVENGIITGIDCAYIAASFYETDENLQVKNADGVNQYKIDKGKHKLRTQSEIEGDPVYIESFNKQIKSKLIDIDSASIRSIREYISSKSDAPQILKNHEAEAKAERAKLK